MQKSKYVGKVHYCFQLILFNKKKKYKLLKQKFVKKYKITKHFDFFFAN